MYRYSKLYTYDAHQHYVCIVTLVMCILVTFKNMV
jgi:hypothetical protein